MKSIQKIQYPAVVVLVWLAAIAASGCQGSPDSLDFSRARERMVRTQIEARGVSDSLVLKAMRRVERHLFVPEGYRLYSYTDGPLPIGEDQTISQPYIVAVMTELLNLRPEHRVLEIGTGSGYQAAILGEIAAEVYTIEIIPSLGHRADSLLDSLGYKNITVRIGDGYVGWEEVAPFDAVILTAAPPEIPQPLLDQLAEGGRLVAPVGEDYQTLQLVGKINGELKYEDVGAVRFVPMTGRAQDQK
jgi:protein-L-isoaspartate(D-aspartate) O-methyltransferase